MNRAWKIATRAARGTIVAMMVGGTLVAVWESMGRAARAQSGADDGVVLEAHQQSKVEYSPLNAMPQSTTPAGPEPYGGVGQSNLGITIQRPGGLR